MNNGYLTIDQCMAIIDLPYQEACARVLERYREQMEEAPGSSHNHQAWPGGYVDHVTEVLNIAHLLYGVLSEMRPLPFSLSDAFVVLFWHDVEKVFRDRPLDKIVDKYKEQAPGMREKDYRKLAVLELIGFKTKNPDITNGIFYAEGEVMDYSPKERKMRPLAAFAHMCDITSARIWFDRPQAEGEVWGERRRSAGGICNQCQTALATGDQKISHDSGEVTCYDCFDKQHKQSVPTGDEKIEYKPLVTFTLKPGEFKVP